jgi:GxxExxY protein
MVLEYDSELTRRIIVAAIEVHRALGPGLLESLYEECLCCELKYQSIAYRRQVTLPVTYRDIRVDGAFRMDVVVEGSVVVEIKAVDRLAPVHEAQLLTYLRLSGLRVGLLMNFHSAVLKDGLRRVVL